LIRIIFFTIYLFLFTTSLSVAALVHNRQVGENKEGKCLMYVFHSELMEEGASHFLINCNRADDFFTVLEENEKFGEYLHKNKPFTGTFNKIYSDQLIKGKRTKVKKKGTYNFIDGIKQGEEITYYDSGQKEITLFYKNNIQQCEETHYYKNGNKKAIINYKDGLKHGSMTSWHKNGKILGVATFKNDHHDGVSHAWYDDGSLKAKAYFSNGHQNGLEVQYYKNGNKRIEGNWKDGKLDGLEKTWHKNGVKKSETLYKNGKIELNHYMKKNRIFWNDKGEEIKDIHLTDIDDKQKFVH